MANLKEYIKKLEIENKSLKDKLASEKQSTKEAYQQLTEAKLSQASTESEFQSAIQKAHVTAEKLKQSQDAYTKLEEDLYKVSEKLGTSLNRTNELELAIFAITDKMEQMEPKKSKRKENS